MLSREPVHLHRRASKPRAANAHRSAFLLTLLVALVAIMVLPAIASADTSGPREAGSGANVVIGANSTDWANPGNITSPGTPYASTTLSGGASSDYICATAYGFDLPDNAVIGGIQVAINKQGEQSGIGSYGIYDTDVYLTKNGSAYVGTDKAITSTRWSTSFTVSNYGSTSDLWGTTWSRAEIESATFGVLLKANNTGLSSRTAQIDYIRITVTYTIPDTTPPTVTSISPAGANPTNSATATYTVAFSEPVTGVATGNFGLTTTGTVTGASVTSVSAGPGATRTVTVNTGTGDGTIRLDLSSLTPAITDAAGNALNTTYNSGTALTVDKTAPTVTIDQASAQADPTNASPIDFTVVFSEPVTDFVAGDVTLTSEVGGTVAVTGSGTTYNVAVTGMSGAGNVVASLAAGVASDAAGNASAASTSTDNSVYFDNAGPSVQIEQAAGQADPTNDATIHYTATFSESIPLLPLGSFTITNGSVTSVTDTSAVGTVWDVTVTATDDGPVTLSMAAGQVADALGNWNSASASADNSVVFDDTPPVVDEPLDITQEADGASTEVAFSATANDNLTGATIRYWIGGSEVTSPHQFPVGTTTVTVTAIDGAGNVSSAPDKAFDVTINKRVITVTAHAQSKIYGETDPELTYTVAPAWAAAVLSGDLARAAGEDVNDYAIAQGSLASPTEWSTLTFNGATFSITPRTLTLTVTGGGKVYDGNAATTVTLELGNKGFVDDDVVAIYDTAAFEDEAAGTGKTVDVIGVALNGTDAGNFVPLPTTATTTADITKRAVEIAAVVANSRTYDGTNVAKLDFTDPTLVTKVDGDVVEADPADVEATFADADAGPGKDVTVTHIGLTGADAPNYSLTLPRGLTADINPAELTVTGVPSPTKVYDGTTDVTLNLSGAGLAGVVGTEDVTLDSSGVTDPAQFASKDAGAPVEITYGAFALGGTANLDNYALTQPVITGSITKRSLTIAAVTDSRTYDGTTDSAGVPNVTGLAAGDTIDNLVQVFDSRNAGARTLSIRPGYEIQDGNGGQNYALQPLQSAWGTIDKLAITVTADDDQKVYDGTTVSIGIPTTDVPLGADDEATWTQSFATKNVGVQQITPAGSVNDGNGGLNYDVTLAPVDGEILARALMVTGAAAADKVYDGTTAAVVDFSVASLVGVVGSEDVVLNAMSVTGAFADAGIGAAKPVTVTGLALSGADVGNYTLTVPILSASITGKELTVSGITAADKVYDGTTAATIDTDEAALVGVESGDTVTLGKGSALGAFADKNVGTGKTVAISGLTIGGADAGNYTLTQPTATADITGKELTVSGITAADKVYDGTTAATIDTDEAALVGVESGDTVTLGKGSALGAFADKNVGTGKTVAISGLTIGGADAGNYTLTQPTATADITAKALTITANDQTKVYGETFTFLGTEFTSSGLVDGEAITSVTLTSAGALAGADLGTYPIVPSAPVGIVASNYGITYADGTMTVAEKVLTVTGASAAGKVYNGNTAATLDFSSAGLVGVATGDDVELVTTGAAGTFASKDIGTHSVTVTGLTLSGADAGKYSLQQPTLSAEITAKALTVSSAVAIDKAYNGNTEATLDFTLATLDGVVGSEDVVLDTLSASGAFADANVGTAKPVTVTGLALSGADAGNYTVTAPTLSAAITAKALAVANAVAVDKVYDGNTVATLDFSAADLVGVESGDTVTLDATGATGAFAAANVGTHDVTVTGLALAGAQAGNYSLPAPTLSASIAAKQLIVTATAANKVYDGTTAASVTLDSDKLAADEVTISHTGATFADKNVGDAKVVTVTGIAISGDDAGNYALSNTSATDNADITQRDLTVTATAAGKVYDGTAAATGIVLDSNKLAADTVSLAFGAASFEDKNAGTGKMVTVSGIAISGADAGNYRLLNVTATAPANIAKRDLTVTATAANKVYDGNAAATVNLASDKLLADAVTLTNTTATFADKNVGDDKVVTVGGIAISGADAGNYNLTNATATAAADITQRDLTVTATAANKVYDGTTAATVTLASDKLLGDTLTLASSAATFANADAGIAKVVNVTGIAISGADAGNYNLTNVTATAAADITPKALTITANDQVKVYGQTLTFAGTEFVSNGLVTGETITSVRLTSDGAAAGATLGDYDIVPSMPVVGITAANYTITYVDGTLSVVNQILTVSGATAANKVYDGTTAATLNFGGATLEGVATGDDVTLVTTGATGTFSDKNAAFDKTVTVNGLTLGGDDASQYGLTQPTLEANITKATLTITADSAGKVYGQVFDTTKATCKWTGLAAGDAVTSVKHSCAGAPANAGVTGSPYAIMPSAAVGTDLDTNYEILYRPGILTVAQAATGLAAATDVTSCRIAGSVTMTATLVPANTVSELTGYVTFVVDGETYGTAAVAPVAGATDGSVRATLTKSVSKKPGTYTLAMNFTSNNDNFANSAANASVKVLKPKPEIKPSAFRVKVGKKVTIKGKVNNQSSKQKYAVIKYKAGKKWKTMKKVKLSSGGSYKFTWKTTKVEKRQLRADYTVLGTTYQGRTVKITVQSRNVK